MSQELNTVENLRTWFRSCPAVNNKKRFNVDYLGSDPTEYTVYTTPSPLNTFMDILGNVVYRDQQTLNFIFASRDSYGSDTLQNLANLGFFDEVMTWIYEQNKTKNFPDIREGVALSIMPTLTQYLFQAGTDSGRYQIQCKLTYRRIN